MLSTLSNIELYAIIRRTSKHHTQQDYKDRKPIPAKVLGFIPHSGHPEYDVELDTDGHFYARDELIFGYLDGQRFVPLHQ